VRTHAECRHYEITTKRKEVYGIDPAGVLGLYEREGKSGVVRKPSYSSGGTTC